MATNAKAALLAVTHALALRMLYNGHTSEHTGLEIIGHGPTYPLAIREAVEKSPDGKKLAALIKATQKKLPGKPEQLWGWLEKQTPTVIQSVLAVCVARSIDLVQVNGAEAKPSAGQLTKAIKLDMADRWEASADNYLTRVPKKVLLAELDGVLKPATRKQVVTMKRDPAAKVIARELRGKRWLPEILKVG